MHIIEVIPIAKAIGTDTLSYFSPVSLALGTLVEVPLRNKTVPGIVISVKNAHEMKADLKNAPFALKKIAGSKENQESAQRAKPFFLDAFMRAAEEASIYYAASVGGVLDVLVPDFILKKAKTLAGPKERVASEPEKEAAPIQKNIHEIYAIQGDDEERYGSYRGLIRQEFAKKLSILIILPTIEDAIHTYGLLEKGIEGYAFLLHGSLPPKKITETWNAIMKENHPVVIVATGGFLCIPREDIGSLIIEKENSKGYKSMRRPHIDIRMVAEFYAEKRNIPLFLGDVILRIETLWRESEGAIQQAAPFKFRSLSTAKEMLVDMKQYKNKNGQFKIMGDEMESMIRSNKENSEHMIILSTRRGIAPSVVCADCQTIVTCNECSSPVVLHAPAKTADIDSLPRTHTANFFLCHRCGSRRSSDEVCKICGSWRLATVGIGIDLVAEKIADKFPDINVYRIDSDTTKTERSIRTAVSEWRNHPGSILLGTEMMLLYINEKVHNAAVVSLDSLLSIPDFRIHEKILHTLLKIRSLAASRIIVQTRKADEPFFQYALKGNLSDFYRSTIDERKLFSYPPFTTLIKITLEGKKDVIVPEMAAVQKALEPASIDIFPAFTHTVRGNYVLHGLMRIPMGSWPDKELSAKLRSLPPQTNINVDPDSLL